MRRLLKTNIYISDAKDACDERLLRKNKIKVILNVCNDIDTKQSFKDILYAKWGLDDPREGLAHKNNVEMASTVLHIASHQAASMGGSALVHCAAGHNRSSLVAAVWLVHYKDWKLSKAVKAAEVKDKKNWMIDKGYSW